MGIFSKKSKQDENLIVDDNWMRHDYILVDNNISPKDLKPYQRLIVLRKPTGEQKCVVDVSLPYEELKKLQAEVNTKGYANILDDQITRIIPSEYEYSRYFDHKITEEKADNISSMFSSTSDKEFEEINQQNLPFDVPNASLISLKDNSIDISLVDNNPIELDPEVDNIDNVEIIIPSEDRNANWADFGDSFGESTNEQINNEVSPNENNNEIYYQNELTIAEENYYDENGYQLEQPHDPTFVDEQNNQENIDYQTENDNVDNYNVPVNPQTDYVDYNDENQALTIENKEQEQVYSFFKNKVALRQYEEQKKNGQRNYYSFYKVPESNGNPVKKVMLNKKAKMFAYRRKIDKRLLDMKSSSK
ncbi:hypothetical protein [Malacoplasma iowae]|uniref:Uncharacterized protein n=1 Tax=Malacoplasma iowae 695 TaxID=1048830 RepID=A0A6P1LAU7_MALIO|nr:hypothetical protein [Malacoplasma iowae]QHG89337.1 hypothetical protein EER00_00250 [Malacoplasma iowae 695]WPL35961.1 hypothetical protein QX180_00875 [Malacoplasma iowae]VEU61570.1 Uncharacterised protein [Mycoplasmopsis fermentans]VEU71432.1 Uncharacterised protein [Malacoplasma iowae]